MAFLNAEVRVSVAGIGDDHAAGGRPAVDDELRSGGVGGARGDEQGQLRYFLLCSEAGYGLPGFYLQDIRHDYDCAFGGERPGRRSADTSGRAGNDRRLAIESLHRIVSG